jgi:hypothetical protein
MVLLTSGHTARARASSTSSDLLVGRTRDIISMVYRPGRGAIGVNTEKAVREYPSIYRRRRRRPDLPH